MVCLGEARTLGDGMEMERAEKVAGIEGQRKERIDTR